MDGWNVLQMVFVEQKLKGKNKTHGVFPDSSFCLPSVGELIAFDLLNLGTAGVSKFDLRLTDPLLFDFD